MVINNYFAAESDDVYIYITIRQNTSEDNNKVWSELYNNSLMGNKQNIFKSNSTILLNPEILDTIPLLENLANDDFIVVKTALTTQEIKQGSGELDLAQILPTEFLVPGEYIIQIYFSDNENIYSLPSNILNWNFNPSPSPSPNILQVY